jgi:hypothetical protein
MKKFIKLENENFILNNNFVCKFCNKSKLTSYHVCETYDLKGKLKFYVSQTVITVSLLTDDLQPKYYIEQRSYADNVLLCDQNKDKHSAFTIFQNVDLLDLVNESISAEDLYETLNTLILFS